MRMFERSKKKKQQNQIQSKKNEIFQQTPKYTRLKHVHTLSPKMRKTMRNTGASQPPHSISHSKSLANEQFIS